VCLPTGARLFLGRTIQTAVVPGPVDPQSVPNPRECVLYIRLIDAMPRSELRGQCT